MSEANAYSEPRPKIVVVTGDGTPETNPTPPTVGAGAAGAAGTEVTAAASDPDEAGSGETVGGMVEQPAKVMRIGTMIKQLLEEVRSAPLDEAGRARLRQIHANSITELSTGLAPELREELKRLTLPFSGEVPSESELRVAQAQLVGWLEGLFHGIQTALVAQQMAARAQLEELSRQRALPGPPAPSAGMPAAGGPYL